MMSSKEIEEKERMLSIVAYGCHNKIHKEICKRLEEKHNLKTIFFYEYFMTSPMLKNNYEGKKVRFFAPFLERVLFEMDFIPKSIKYDEIVKYGKIHSEAIDFTPKTEKNKKAFWGEGVVAYDFLKTAAIGKSLYESWYKGEEFDIKKPEMQINIKLNKNKGISSATAKLSTQFLKTQYLIDIGKHGEDKGALMKEYILVVYPWLRDPELKSINIFCASISTKNLFCGYFLLFYPDLDNNETRDNKLDREITDYLIEYIEKIYAPLLALFENYWEENMLKDDIENNSAIEKERYIFLSENLKDSNDIVEQALWKLWNIRMEALNKGKKDDVKESLIFSKYLIGSPGMIDQIKTVMGLNLKSGDSLPAVLVVGGPGSGKDKMSKLIKLFSENYRFGKEYIINMAMLRPKEITVPLLMGTDLMCCLKQDTKDEKVFKNLLIDGIFLKAKTENEKEENGYRPSFIFDELNSLDIESQGSLLRMIENAKIIPIGGLKEETIDFLIIGVMNEDPESITMQRPIEEILKRERIFGGVLGDILYEYFRGMRRLRNDLYYRLIRDGKIVIPDLKKRREDIPIMFYFFVSNLMKKEGRKFDIDIEVYEEIMDQTLMWPGNFRQLQAIAEETVREANKDSMRQESKEELKIRGIHVKKAIDKDPSLSRKDIFLNEKMV